MLCGCDYWGHFSPDSNDEHSMRLTTFHNTLSDNSTNWDAYPFDHAYAMPHPTANNDVAPGRSVA